MKLLLKNLLFTFLVPGTVAGWIPWTLVRDETAVTGPVAWGSAALFLFGTAVYAWCVWDFATFGRGTPAPLDAPKKLVVRGLYRVTRNPMYVGVLSVVLGWAALWQSTGIAVYAAAVATVFHVFILVYEEPKLQALFGDEYTAYRARVGRWLLPPSRKHRAEPP